MPKYFAILKKSCKFAGCKEKVYKAEMKKFLKMRKNRLYLSILAVVCCVIPSMASNWHFGMQFGYNMGIEKSSHIISSADAKNHGIYWDMQGLWQAEGDHGVGISLGLGFSYGEGHVYTLDKYRADLRYTTFYVPLHVSYTVLFRERVAFMLYAGPSMRVPVNYNYTDVVAVDRYTVGDWWSGYDTYTEEIGYRYDRVENHWEHNRTNWMGEDPTCPDGITNGKVFSKCDLGIDFGAAFNIYNVIITAKYTLSPINSNKNTHISDKLYNDGLKIGIGFLL